MPRRDVRVLRVEECPRELPDENKIVDGKEETMGAVNCKSDSDAGSYVCRLNDVATWTWRLGKNVLGGELQYRRQLYRKIHLIRAD
jgi:hypothetical protein